MLGATVAVAGVCRAAGDGDPGELPRSEAWRHLLADFPLPRSSGSCSVQSFGCLGEAHHVRKGNLLSSTPSYLSVSLLQKHPHRTIQNNV